MTDKEMLDEIVKLRCQNELLEEQVEQFRSDHSDFFWGSLINFFGRVLAGLPLYVILGEILKALSV